MCCESFCFFRAGNYLLALRPFRNEASLRTRLARFRLARHG